MLFDIEKRLDSHSKAERKKRVKAAINVLKQDAENRHRRDVQDMSDYAICILAIIIFWSAYVIYRKGHK